MSRLTKRNADGTAWYNHTAEREVKNGDILEKLAHYEDLEEAGRSITLPCNIGDTMWRVVEMSTGKTPTAIKKFVRIVTLTENNAFDISRKFGKTVFLTKAEAEQKLAELKGGGGDE